MKHVNAAMDETRTQELFRQKGRLCPVVPGKRWLFLARWSRPTKAKRGERNDAFALNRRLFKAYFLKEQIERLWAYTYEGAARRFFEDWVRCLRWQRLPAFRKFAVTLSRHLEGILNYFPAQGPLRRGASINANIRSTIWRGRSYRDHEYLVLKVQRSSARAGFEGAA